jgi:hypothetical protein
VTQAISLPRDLASIILVKGVQNAYNALEIMEYDVQDSRLLSTIAQVLV